MSEPYPQYPPIPPDDPGRSLTAVQTDKEENLPHLGVVGDTYTITVSSDATDGRFCIVDMHIPPGGGPPPHRHDFEETFILLEGELDVTFRGEKSRFKTGTTVNVPANAPHHFHNASSKPVRMLCICSPGGNDRFFKEIGTVVDSRTAPPPKLDPAQQAAFIKKARELTPKYRTELLEQA